jgi:transcriptional regulator with XRE-family HTH domain
MTDIPTLANGGAPAAPAPAPSPSAPASATPPAASPRPSAPPNPRSTGYSPSRDTHARLREAQEAARGTYEQVRYAQDQARGEAPPGDQPAPPPSGDQQQPPADAAAKTKVGRYEVSETQLGEMMQRQAADDLKKATLPTRPEEYKAELPADLKLPGGLQFKVDANDPSFIAARNLAFSKGWSQADLSEALGVMASHLSQQEAQLAERSRAEIAKAGVNAPQRVDAVIRWITGTVGDADAKPIVATIVTDAHLRFYEKIMHQLEGGTSFSQKHRVAPPDADKIPGYENMSFEQRRFAQDQRLERRGR